jgi:hypothetical protein
MLQMEKNSSFRRLNLVPKFYCALATFWPMRDIPDASRRKSTKSSEVGKFSSNFPHVPASEWDLVDMKYNESWYMVDLSCISDSGEWFHCLSGFSVRAHCTVLERQCRWSALVAFGIKNPTLSKCPAPQVHQATKILWSSRYQPHLEKTVKNVLPYEKHV